MNTSALKLSAQRRLSQTAPFRYCWTIAQVAQESQINPDGALVSLINV
jgi:hypothetical protein